MTRIFFIFLLLSPTFSFAQDYEPWEEDVDTSRFFIGINIGAFFPNHNTADLYTGRPDVTSFGIEHIFEQPFNRQVFDDYFGAPYEIVEYTFEPRYTTSAVVGMHFQYQLDSDISFFLDFNTVQLDFEQFFTVQVDDPTNQMPGPTLERLPVIGEENRFLLNVGTQIHYFQGETSSGYLELFGHFNNIQVQSNYIVIDGIEYNIFHDNPTDPNLQPGGNGWGGGMGTGFRFLLGQRVWIDMNYHLTYAEVNLSETISENGLQNTLMVRGLWAF